jgi:hypothetical protein
MPQVIHSQSSLLQSRIQRAIDGLKKRQFRTQAEAAARCGCSYDTLKKRLGGRADRVTARQNDQILEPAEETTLLRYITRLTRTGYQTTPRTVRELAEKLQRDRPYLSTNAAPTVRSCNPNWWARFRKRHPHIQTVYTRQISRDRYTALTPEAARVWFDAVAEARSAHDYLPFDIWNMDETGFGVGDGQSTAAVVNVYEGNSNKVIHGRQEWLTSVECVNAAGRMISPMIIYKGQTLDEGSLPDPAPEGWKFECSHKGWSNDYLGFKWLTEVFDPQTRPEDPNRRRLLILDGHSSHTTGKFIEFCMKNGIELLLLPPHSTHLLQPLDICIFGPLKSYLQQMTDGYSALTNANFLRSHWTEMYIKAREKAFRTSNINSAWRSAGLWPLAPENFIRRLRETTSTTANRPSTPPNPPIFGVQLLLSSPPDNSTLADGQRTALAAVEQSADLSTPVKRFIRTSFSDHRLRCSESIIDRVTIKKQSSLLNATKKPRRGKQTDLRNIRRLTTNSVLTTVRGHDARAAARKPKKKPIEERNVITTDDGFVYILESDSDISDASVAYVG